MNIASKLQTVSQKIQVACNQTQQNNNPVTLVAVSKTQPLTAINEAYQAGQRHFGENRVAEAEDKWLAASFRDKITLHMVGTVQTRQVAKIVKLFDWVHSVDALKIAQKLNQAASKMDKKISVLIQVNVSGEESKAGFGLCEWFEKSNQAQLELFIKELEQISLLKNLEIKGLMTMAPHIEPEKTRFVFQRVKKLQTVLQQRLPKSDWTELSMGMTNDYVIAIEEGATLVRIGTALFGERQFK